MNQWKNDFMTRRRTETQDLSELLNGMEIKPYPEASLLEKIQRQYNFNTQAEYQEIVGRMSFFRRGELKMEIRKEWEEWTKDFSQQLIEFIRVGYPSTFSIEIETFHSARTRVPNGMGQRISHRECCYSSHVTNQ